MSSVIKENYLKALYFLSEKDGEVTLTDLGKVMNVSKPTVNGMVKKMQQNGWIKYTKYKPLKITKAGKKAAALVIRKHRLSELFLTQVMGFGWEEVHAIAEELEHIKSEAFFDRMNEILGYPTADPHGSPIPDKDGKVVKHNYKSISEYPVNTKVTFKAIRDSSNELLLFLNRKDLSLGSKIKIIEIEAYDKSMSIAYGKIKRLQLSQAISKQLLVSE